MGLVCISHRFVWRCRPDKAEGVEHTQDGKICHRSSNLVIRSIRKVLCLRKSSGRSTEKRRRRGRTIAWGLGPKTFGSPPTRSSERAQETLNPEVFFIEDKSVCLEQPSKFFLERPSPVMDFLGLDITPDPLHLPGSDGEGGVTRLPGKMPALGKSLMDPASGFGFDFSNRVRNGDRLV